MVVGGPARASRAALAPASGRPRRAGLAASQAPPRRPPSPAAAARHPVTRRHPLPRSFYDYCTPNRDVTNLGCLCKAVWIPPAPGGSGAEREVSKPVGNATRAIIGGRCADVPLADGSTAGGPWCETVPKTCSNNPKASHLPAASHDFDFCTSNKIYQSVREHLLPLDRAAAGGLPPIPDTPAYTFARHQGVAALGGYISTTQSGCKCSPWSWTYYDAVTGVANGSYIGGRRIG